MACEYCDIINGKNKAFLVYEDDKIVAMLSPNPASIGHILVMPKQHFPIIEMVPDYLISHIGVIANKLSIAVFETLNAHGTNMFIANGVPAGQTSSHFMLHLIPRRENDNIDFEWKPRQLNEEEFSTIELQIKEFTKTVGEFEEEKKEEVVAEKPPEETTEEDLRVEHLTRIP